MQVRGDRALHVVVALHLGDGAASRRPHPRVQQRHLLQTVQQVGLGRERAGEWREWVEGGRGWLAPGWATMLRTHIRDSAAVFVSSSQVRPAWLMTTPGVFAPVTTSSCRYERTERTSCGEILISPFSFRVTALRPS